MPDQFGALLVFAVIATGSPGGATALATASGARFGYLKSIPLLLGFAWSPAGLMALSGTSLAAIFQAAPAMALSVKAVGSLYLLWLAIRIGVAGAPQRPGLDDKRPMRFVGGVFLLLVNSKAWAMAIGVASTYSDLVSDPIFLGAVLALVFALSASLSLTIWVLIGSMVAQTLHAEWQWHLFNGFLATLLVASILQLWM